MASTSSMTSSLPNQTTFDVFISFRGADTRHSFTDHIYAALKQAAIHTFRDDTEMKSGQGLESEIVKAIENSRASIVVLSENYAKSRWCLEELWLILEQKRKRNHFVLPVFYLVEPSDVRSQRGNFAIEVNEGIEGSKWTEVNVNRWKSALTEVANLSGMVASGSETKFIAKIVYTVDHELDSKLVSTPTYLTGMDERAKDINLWLKNETSNANVLAICGMGGSGKTTLAQYIYNSHKHNFESSCFLEEIGKYAKKTYGLLKVQKQLLRNILGGKDQMISCVAEGTNKINKVLQMKKALIVFDDIDENDELATLLGTSFVNTQSKIIITTRLQGVHLWFESMSWMCHVYKHRLLNHKESLKVLCFHAFGSDVPPEGFTDLAIGLAHYCEGNPLALKVLGSSLFVSAQHKWERETIKEIWRSRLKALSSLRGDLDCRIQEVLRKSFDYLPLASERELFLHIVFFFADEDEDYVLTTLEYDWHAKAGIKTLIDRSLLTISPNKKLAVHQLLQDMARSIVHEESKDPSKRTRVCCSDEAYHLLTQGEGSETIEGLRLDMRKLKQGTYVSSIRTSSLAKMHNLKLLQLKYVNLKGDYTCFRNVRWLSWQGCKLRTIPSSLLMSNFLVAIDMTKGNLEKFEPPTILNSMKILNLTTCYKLVSINNLSRLPHLETLILWGCINLTSICKTIGELERLFVLNLTGCKKLWKHMNQQGKLKVLCIGGRVSEKPLFTIPRSLKFLFLDNCNLEYHNDLRVVCRGLILGMSLRDNLFELMPDNIDLKLLRVLNLTSCVNLKSLLSLPSKLEELYTYNCKSLEKVTFQSTRFKLLKFGYKGCYKLSEVEGLFKLVAIKELDEANLGHMKWVKEYQDHKVDLVGDEITKGRVWHIQMLYEYGIRSTYLQGAIDQIMWTFEHTSSCHTLSFRVSLHPNKHRIQGLNVGCLYRSLGSTTDEVTWPLFTIIKNITKGISWIYNPFVYCKPRADEEVMWLSYWSIGNILDVGNEVLVCFMVNKNLIISKCGVTLLYADDEVEQDNKRENNTTNMKEVIGGDLSEYEVTKGTYYLCRRDFFKLETPHQINSWFKDMIPYTALQGWRKSYESQYLDASYMELNNLKLEVHRDILYKGIWLGMSNCSEREIRWIEKRVSKLEGVDYVNYLTRTKELYVSGAINAMEVQTRVKAIVNEETNWRKIEDSVKILGIDYNVKRYVHLELRDWRSFV